MTYSSIQRLISPFVVWALTLAVVAKENLDLSSLPSPILFRGDATTAYRDPAAVYHDGVFHLFFTFVQAGADGRPWMFTATSQSRDLHQWSPPRILTPKDRSLNFSSPGNVIRYEEEWILCLQTYPRPDGEKYGNQDARLWIIRSPDLQTWSEPELLRVKGPTVAVEAMGRMIDPFLLQDTKDPTRWWCFYKQNGLSLSWSSDLKNWTYAGHVNAGENPCVVALADGYVLFHSPGNGVGVKRSTDLRTWRDEDLIVLGQADWPWARGRLTAGFVLDLRRDPTVAQALLFFHGSGPEDERTYFDHHASIGLAWSQDLKHWHWPDETAPTVNDSTEIAQDLIQQCPKN